VARISDQKVASTSDNDEDDGLIPTLVLVVVALHSAAAFVFADITHHIRSNDRACHAPDHVQINGTVSSSSFNWCAIHITPT
jgi:hypothetical protein